jgi:hypothetical protein
MKLKTLSLVLFTLLTSLLAACGSASTPATSEAAQFFGIVSANLTLNGQRLNLANASITQDGDAATSAVVQPGVELEATGKSSDDGFDASSIDAKTRVKGQVDTVNTNGLEVVGVAVAVDANTVIVTRAADGTFTKIALTDIEPSDYLEVYGVPRNDDSILATRIVRKIEDNINKVELRVKIRGVDITAKTFTYGLGTHTVNYANAEVRGAVTEGAMLRVRGVRNGLTITAERVRTGEGRGNEDGNNGGESRNGKIELEGIIAELNETAKTFKILDFTVNYSGAEVRGTLSNGAWVEVKGRVENATAPIVASRVKLEGKWDDSDEDDSNDDNGGNDDGGDNSGDDNDGDDNGGDDNSDDSDGADGEFEITSSVSGFDASTNSFMLGSTKVTVLATTEYKNAANDNISPSEFWGANRNGALVKVEGAKREGTLVARQVKLR